MDIYEELSKITENCPVCAGRGFVYGEEQEPGLLRERFECSCIAKIDRKLCLHRAKIPKKYRDFDLRRLTWEFKKRNKGPVAEVQDYAQNFKKHVKNGDILWLWSPPGLAKSSMVGWALSRALDQGLTPYYIKADQLITMKMDANRDDAVREEYNYILDEVSVLAIEEIEKIYLPGATSYVTQSFYSAISEIYDTKKSLIITSNMAHKEVLQMFPNYVADRLKDNLTFLVFIGKSGRG